MTVESGRRGALDRTTKPFSILSYYLASLRVGFPSLLEREMRIEGLKRIGNPLSFPRPEEFREALHDLAPDLTHGRVLDVGSPKLPVLLLAAARPGLELYATDILPDFIESTRHFLAVAGHGDRIDRTIHLGTEDARQLSFPDDFFDWVYSISVLEHVADEDTADGKRLGDSAAAREIARVLRPGGVATLTLPYEPKGYWEEFVQSQVYEREGTQAGPTFYQRWYDDDALRTRILEPSGLSCEARVFFGEPARLKLEPWWNRIPMKAKAPLLPVQGFVGNLLFRALADDQRDSARGVALKLVKTAAPLDAASAGGERPVSSSRS